MSPGLHPEILRMWDEQERDIAQLERRIREIERRLLDIQFADGGCDIEEVKRLHAQRVQYRSMLDWTDDHLPRSFSRLNHGLLNARRDDQIGEEDRGER